MPDPAHDNSEITVELDARPDLLGILRGTIEFWCRRRGIGDDRAHQLAMGVDEAAANIIRHAYGDQGGRIRMACAAARTDSGADLTITLEDDGRQVPVDLIKSRHLDDIRPGGLGVHLIQQAADDVTWRHRPEGGTMMTMRVRVSVSDALSTEEIPNGR